MFNLNKFKYFITTGLFFAASHPVMAQLRNWDEDLNPSITGVQSCLVDGVPTLKCSEIVIGNVLIMANAFILLVLFIMFVIGSFKYLTSLGNAEKIEEAKGTFKWAIIGLLVYVSAFIILTIIDFLFLGGNGQIFIFKIGD